MLDYCEATDWGCSGFDPELIPDPDGDDDPDDSPAPVCARCGGGRGVILAAQASRSSRSYRGDCLDLIEPTTTRATSLSSLPHSRLAPHLRFPLRRACLTS